MSDMKESNNIKQTLSDLKNLLLKLSKEASEKVPGVVQQVMQIVGENIEGVGKMMKKCSAKTDDQSCHEGNCSNSEHCHEQNASCEEKSCSNDEKCSEESK